MTADLNTIRFLEELGLNAWPTLHTLTADGWLLRFANGYTRRANSVTVLYPTTLPLQDKIQYCESIYTQHGLPTVFKLHAACQPADLDRVLDQRGYEHDALSSVQTVDLVNVALEDTPNAAGSAELTEAWLTNFVRLSNVAERNIPPMTAILNAMMPEHTFAQIIVDGQVVAMGIGVVDHGYVSFHDIVVAESHRQRSYGKQLMRSLLAWGKSVGATRGFLQVMCNNPAALRLYSGLGFSEAYQYWYRVKRIQ